MKTVGRFTVSGTPGKAGARISGLACCLVLALLLGPFATARAADDPVLDNIERLRTGGGYVSARSAEILGNLGDRRAVPALIQALGSSDIVLRMEAAMALMKIRDPSAVPALIEAMQKSDPSTRYFAADALGCIGDPRATEALIAALKDESIELRGRRPRPWAWWATPGRWSP